MTDKQPHVVIRDPKRLRDECTDSRVRNFLLREELAAAAQ